MSKKYTWEQLDKKLKDRYEMSLRSLYGVNKDGMEANAQEALRRHQESLFDGASRADVSNDLVADAQYKILRDTERRK